MATYDITYDEDNGNPATPDVLVSCLVSEAPYQSMQKVLPWRDPANGDPLRKVVPIIHLGEMVAEAVVPSPI